MSSLSLHVVTETSQDFEMTCGIVDLVTTSIGDEVDLFNGSLLSFLHGFNQG